MLNFLKQKKVYWEYFTGCNYHPKLTNGLHSDVYFNFSRLNKFSDFKYFLEETNLLDSIKNIIGHIDCLCGQSYGSIYFANVLGIIFDIPVIFTEKKNGEMFLNRFPIFNYKSILVVEDVITTGKTTIETIKTLSPVNVYPIIFALVEYNDINILKYGNSLFQIISGLNIGVNFYEEEECKLCKYGSKAIRPKENWEFFVNGF